MIQPPDHTEAAEYYFRYIDQVVLAPGQDICEALASQLEEVRAFCLCITEEQSLRRYAPGKWSIRQVLNHISDNERVFAYRALWFARGFDVPLSRFDEGIAAVLADADSRSWASHVEEFESVRAATLTLFGNLPSNAWMRRGVASGNPFTVRALAFVTAGHVTHHCRILRERYLGK